MSPWARLKLRRVDPALDWITGALAAVTAVMAGATVWLGWQTRDAVKVAEKEAEATVALGTEARRDRDLAVQPVLVLIEEQASGTPTYHAVRLRNIGRGPAIRTRVFRWAGGALFWNSGPGFPLAAGETHPPVPTPGAPSPALHLDSQRGASGVKDIPGGERPTADQNLLAICLDQVGNALYFNLRTGDPPVLSRPSDPERPAWATAALEAYTRVQPPDA